MLPYLVAGVSAVYQAGRMYDSWRYWNDYYKNTGVNPRYPLKNDVYGFGRGLTIMGGFNRSRPRTVNRYITNRNRYYYFKR